MTGTIPVIVTQIGLLLFNKERKISRKYRKTEAGG